MANHRQQIEDASRLVGNVTQIVVTALGATCALWLLLGYRGINQVAWFFIVIAALLALFFGFWGGLRLRTRIHNYESHEGLIFSAEFTDQLRVFGAEEGEEGASGAVTSSGATTDFFAPVAAPTDVPRQAEFV